MGLGGKVIRGLTAGLAVLASAACWTSALAQPAPHDIPWFEARPAERTATLRACRNDERLARQAVCANAEHAANRVGARERARTAGVEERRRSRTIDDVLADPSYYAANRVARAGLLAECAIGGAPGGMKPLAQHCAAARAGAAMDQGARNRGG